MLSKSNDTTIPVKNIQKLIIKFYKYLYGLTTTRMKEMFIKRLLKYNLQNCRVTFLQNPKTKKYGADTITYKAAQLFGFIQIRNKKLAL